MKRPKPIVPAVPEMAHVTTQAEAALVRAGRVPVPPAPDVAVAPVSREVEVVRESAASSARRPHARGVAPTKATKTKTDRATASRPANVTRARAKKASVVAPATVAREVVHESRAVSAARPHAHGGVPVVPQGRKVELQLPSASVAAAVPRLGDDEKVGILGYGNVGLNPSAPSAAFVQYIGTTNPYSVTIVAGGVQQTINVVPEQVINPQVAVAVYLLAQYPNFWQAVNGWTPPPSGAPSGPLVTITAANSPYQITSANELIMCDTTAGPITVYLPNATQFANYQFTVKCSADGGTGNAVSIQPLLAATPIETIDGLSALALTFPMSATPASDGSVWHTVSGYDQGGGGGGGGVSSFNTRTGAVVLNSSDVAAALPSSVVTSSAPTSTSGLVFTSLGSGNSGDWASPTASPYILDVWSLAASVSAGASTATIANTPAADPPGWAQVVIDPYTANAEILQVTSISGTTLNFSGQTFSYPHAAGVPVIVVKDRVYAEWFGVKSGFVSSYTGNAAALLAALTQMARSVHSTPILIIDNYTRMDGSVAFPSSIATGVKVTGNGTLTWLTDLGTGHVGIDLSTITGIPAGGGPTWEVSLQGPQPGRPALGTDPGGMNGIRMPSQSILRGGYSAFRTNILLNGYTGGLLDGVTSTSCYEACAMESGAGGVGGNTARACIFENSAWANFSWYNTAQAVAFRFEDGENYAAPCAHYFYSGSNCDGMILSGWHAFQQIGNAIFYGASGASGAMIICESNQIQVSNALPDSSYYYSGLAGPAVFIGLGGQLQGAMGGFLWGLGAGVPLFLSTDSSLGNETRVDFGNTLQNLWDLGSNFFAGSAVQYGPGGGVITHSGTLESGTATATTTPYGVTRGDLLETYYAGSYANSMRQYQTVGAPPSGIALETALNVSFPQILAQVEGTATINVQPGNTIAQYAYVKPDPSNHGRVIAAAGSWDGPIVGWALKHNNASSSGFGSANTVLVQLTMAGGVAPTPAQIGALPSTDDLSAIATANPTAASVPMNSHKITGLANGTVSTDAATYGQVTAAASPVGAFTGDGSDGAVTLDGTATYGFITNNGSVGSYTYTLSRDIYLTTLAVSTGITLNTNGYRVFANTSVTNNGTIQSNGGTGAAAGTAGGAAGVVFAQLHTVAGGAGGTGAGSNAPSSSALTTSASAAGGLGSSGAGGSGSSNQNLTSNYLRNPIPSLVGAFTYGNGSAPQICGGGGGGGGGGDGTNHGGGGGGGGGFIAIYTPAFTNGATGTLSAAGGAGGTPTTGNAGGGGGGGGGFIVVYTGATWTQSGTVTVAGGTGGSGVGTGASGGNGPSGASYNVVI